MDSRSGITTVYYYDLIGRLVGYHETSTTLDHRVTYSYDEQDRPKAMKETVNGYTKTYTYTYNKEDKLASMTVDGITLNYTYDAFGRLATQTKVYNTTNTTVKTNNISYTGTSTTTSNQISSYNGWTYTYNNKGYIASVTPDANTTHYTYNSAGFLIREDNQKLGKSFRWRYDKAGNITAKETYEHTTGTLGTPLKTVTYTYGSEDAGKWNDLLTGYNGQALTYNDMGSLKSDGTWNYYWKRGRELGSMVSDDTTWTYSYNGDGIRIGRTDGTNTYTYIYNGDKLTRVQYNGKLVRYNYDESGRPISLRYNNVLYFVDTNLQGDVVGIRETEENERVVNYVYDAYGKVCSITGTLKDSLGVHNVLRYRGYVYDQETGLYYLQSRYYNPEWGRFISADAQLAGASGSLEGTNLFVYSNNNPVNMVDPNGKWAEWFETTIKVVSAVVVVAAVVATAVAVSAFTAGTGSAAAVYGATILLGAALSGINGAVANESNGNSYANGYAGGLISGGIQSAASRLPGGTVWGGTIGTSAGTAATMALNNIDPYSANSTGEEIGTAVINSAVKATATSMITASIGAGAGGINYKTGNLYGGVADGCGGLMPSLTLGFCEGIKAFFGAVDDALVYIWE